MHNAQCTIGLGNFECSNARRARRWRTRHALSLQGGCSLLIGNHTPPNPLYLRGGDFRPADLRSSIFDPRLLFLLEIVVIHLDAEDDDAAHCGDEVGPEDCEALAKDAKHNTLQHKGDAANANH